MNIIGLLLLGAAAGALLTYIFLPRSDSGPALVLSSEPWPEESLADRHIRHAAEALTDRELNTDVAIEDALASAERFIAAARQVRLQQREAA